MAIPWAFEKVKTQDAPTGPFDLSHLQLSKVHQRGDWEVAQLRLPDATAAARDAVVDNLVKGESFRGNSRILRRSEKRKGRTLDIHLQCAHGRQDKPESRRRAEQGPDDLGDAATACHSTVSHLTQAGDHATPLAPPPQDVLRKAALPEAAASGSADINAASEGVAEGVGAQAHTVPAAAKRRRLIEHGESIKRGCLYSVYLKQYVGHKDKLLVQVGHKEHVDARGEHPHISVAKYISDACRNKIYDRLVTGWTADAIISGAMFQRVTLRSSACYSTIYYIDRYASMEALTCCARAANKAEILARHWHPHITKAEQLQSIQANYQDARDYFVGSKDVANLRSIRNELTFKLHSQDAQSVQLMVSCKQAGNHSLEIA